ncbi:hypothetical protein A9Y76_10805 [Ralstonia insidiosa]|jgi:TonB-dependent Receptor Plug Domain|uniref:TonB-dependent receptor plug domain-containing protein n=2 Tax=Ralstonia TaxID=48736 RepID=A0A191ZXS8_9RALS|nr:MULTISPECIES: Plug domain-containing protein [Ralstonia]ANJ72924.1 hypothetical protein A9Y76_10805 [Ralstonia insidiosa]EPX97113.1 hypothetical protein C404_14970 [Ralstonia sp. AU12-08]MBT2177865.1 TonB-dependent receptor plug domain-containing protein [Ralstonia pickettii]CAJ0723049.1 hypothetical protein R38712_01593 [Ralstonia pickettii]
MISYSNGAAQLRVLHGQRLPTWWLLPAWPISWTFAVLLGTSPGPSLAAEGADLVVQPAVSPESGAVGLQRIKVVGRGASRIDRASTASEGSVSGTDLAVRPLLRTAELLEAMPGMIAAQHSGGGKANQYFLRGFNLDHGTDFSLLVDEVPLNFRTHGHGQGYLDVGGLIPEIVTRID